MRISEHEFADVEVVLDFHEFDHCTFRNCRFVINGYGPFTMSHNTIEDCAFVFAGPALNTISLLTALYQNEGSRTMVEHWLNAIRSGQDPQLPAG